MPEAVKTHETANFADQRTVDPYALIASLVGAVNELSAKVRTLEGAQ